MNHLPATDGPAFLMGDAAVAARMRTMDWADSPLGPPEHWPATLRQVVSLMMSSKFPMFVAWGAELGFLYNDAYAEILGAKHPAALGRPFEAVWGEIWSEIRPLVEAAMRGEATYRQDLPLVMRRHGGDEQTWFTFSYSPVRDDDGRVAGMFCACTETTGRVLAERAMRESDARFRNVADHAPMMMWVTEPDGRCTYLNKGWYAFTGQTPEQAEGFGWLDATHPDDADEAERIFREANDARAPFRLEYRLRRADGRYRWMLDAAAPRFADDGAFLGYVGSVVDIDARREIEDRHRESEAALRRLTGNLEGEVAARSAERDRLWNLSQDMLARADYSGMMSAVSPAWGQVLGWEERDLLTRGYATFMHPDDEGATLAAISHMAQTRQPARFENRIATRDGGWKPIEWMVAPEPDGTNFIAVGRDLSAAKAREAELAIAQDALRQSQKMEAMGSLTGGVAHDFNNLLTPIIGSLDLLVRKGLGNERERRLIDGALQSAERAKTLVQRLLAFARRQPLQTVAVDVATLVGEMAGLIGSTVGPAIDVQAELAADLPSALADRNQLEMALLNLAVNARDAMPDGGRLTIAAGRDDVRAPHPAGLAPGDYVRLGVGDSGTGMDEATRQRAVEPFFSTKGIGKGTGLGLSMVHGLAAQLGGGMTIASAPGQGTTVTLWLPAGPRVTAARSDAAAPAAGRGGNGVALLVDDEELVRATTADMMIDMGFDVVEAGSAEGALVLIDDGLMPDVLVTDHLMPGMSGAELASIVRDRSPDMPVLIVSGYADAGGIAPDIARLSKPFRAADLAACLAALMPGR